MLYLNERAAHLLKKIKPGEFCVITDFDRTITTKKSPNSWNGVLEYDNFVSAAFTEESVALFEYYFPKEYDNSISIIERRKMVGKWWEEGIALFVEYGLTEEKVLNAGEALAKMQFRKGGERFLRAMQQMDTPVVIISAGIGHFIEQFLRLNGCWSDNIHLIANFIEFANGVATGVKGPIIHTFNKHTAAFDDELTSKLQGRETILLLGDNLADAKMVPDEKREQMLKVGFLDYEIEKNLPYYKRAFDVVCTDNTSFDELMKTLGLD
ncbi:MAG: haloacid dehalogenase-like hydrolase [Candidatus Nomurabacteria bacterium]|jgi:HAD superfamily hydrolase (TIGR01544 family)|nr:haloacid dehalogenase-like hydrolase [Candidatus Nomurabacteria bacterium]